MRILIIDDDAGLRKSLSMILEDAGYDVLQAEDGQAGLQAAAEKLPDIILCDVRMPQPRQNLRLELKSPQRRPRRQPWPQHLYRSAGVGDLLVVSVKKGTPQMRRQLLKAVIIRQRRPFRRPDGTMVQFDDNAAVIIADNGDTKGSDIKGPVAREAAERWPRIAATASMIV